jgi:esterase/lipase superfamily enzyme
MVRELPVEPIVPALATLPIKVLLALGKAATEGDRQSIFNLPAAAAEFLGDWSRIRTVLNLRIWAPGWNDDQLRSYVNAAGQTASSRKPSNDTLRASSLLGLHVRYDIVHCISSIGNNYDGDPLLFLGFGRHRMMSPGTLRDALVRCGTRLLILHSLGSHNRGDSTERLAEFIGGAGGPAVLVVADDGTHDVDAYLRNLYGRILSNQPIADATDVSERGPSTLLVYGRRGDRLLRFDALMERLEKELGNYSGLVKNLLDRIRDQRGRLRVPHAPTSDELHSLDELDSRIDTELARLADARSGVNAHAAEAAILLAGVVANVRNITKDIGLFPGEGHLHTKFDQLVYRLWQAEREPSKVPPEQPDEAPDNTDITVFFGTNRSKASEAVYYGTERDLMHFGRCVVNVPSDRPIGTIPRPSTWSLYRENPQKHFVVLNVVECDRDEFVRDLRTYEHGCSSKQALVFVHGFNVKFVDAIFRTAQIAADLDFPGVAIAFSWPSKGVMTPLGYTHDEGQARWTLPDLREFLDLIAQQSGASTIHLVAHSMGNRALTEALKQIRPPTARATPATFNEVILTAPDIDADTFTRDVAPAILPAARRITLYASSKDVALRFSKKVHGYPRAGESGENIVLLDGLDTIDVSSVDTSLVGHSYYGDNRSVLSDMFNLIRGQEAANRFGLKKRTKGGRSYWAFRPAR